MLNSPRRDSKLGGWAIGCVRVLTPCPGLWTTVGFCCSRRLLQPPPLPLHLLFIVCRILIIFTFIMFYSPFAKHFSPHSLPWFSQKPLFLLQIERARAWAVQWVVQSYSGRTGTSFVRLFKKKKFFFSQGVWAKLGREPVFTERETEAQNRKGIWLKVCS